MDTELIKIADTVYKPLIAKELLRYKKAEEASKLDAALAAGKEYAPATGYGAAAGALAGVPIGLLAQAMFGKEKGLRGYLRAALLGGLGGAGLGALGGAGLHHYKPEMAADLMGKADNLLGRAGGMAGGAYDSASDAVRGLFSKEEPAKKEPATNSTRGIPLTTGQALRLGY